MRLYQAEEAEEEEEEEEVVQAGRLGQEMTKNWNFR